MIIIGSGPAGYTAAVYAARANLAPLVFEGSVTAGGALMNTTEVENFPGFRDGIMGPALMDEMRAQAERFGAELVADDVTEVDLTGDVKVVTDGAGTEHRARAVILATGSGYRKLGVEGEDRLSGHGVSWCATCDGFFFRDQHIAVVGGGDSAVEEATFLSRFGSKVTLIHRRDELRASKIMQERAFADPKIEFAWNSAVDDDPRRRQAHRPDPGDTVTGEKRELDATGLFIAVGHDPRSELLGGQVDLDENGYVLVDQPSTRTNLRRRVRLRRPGRPPLPAGHHRRRHRLCGRARRRALPRGPRPRRLQRGLARGHRERGRAAHRAGADRRRLSHPAPPVRLPDRLPGGRNVPRLVLTDQTDAPPTPPLKEHLVAEMQAITDADFDASVLKSDKPVLVDFWAEWCGPCRQVDPILKEIAAEHGEKITFVKMNVDENPVTPAAYRVTGIPTLNVFQKGELVKQIVGAKPKAALLSELERLHRLSPDRASTPAPSPGTRASPVRTPSGRDRWSWRMAARSVWLGRIRTLSPTCVHARGVGMSDLETAPTPAPTAPLFRLGDRGRGRLGDPVPPRRCSA